MIKSQDNQTCQQILEAAERLFAAKSFYGTRVDEIAKYAGVNKATIYYYFPSKQAILDQLIDDFLKSFVETSAVLLQAGNMQTNYIQTLRASHAGTIQIVGEEGLARLLTFLDSWADALLAFLKGKRDILRIMFMESLLDGENQRLPFRLSDIVAAGNNLFPEQYQLLGLEKLSDETVIIKFFGGLLPLAYYAICEDAWCQHYGMAKERLREGILALFHIELEGYFTHMKDL